MAVGESPFMLLSAIVLDPELLKRYRPQVHKHVWSDPYQQEVAQAIIDIYDQIHRPPSREALTEAIKLGANGNQGRRDRLLDLCDAIYEHDPSEMQTVFRAAFMADLKHQAYLSTVMRVTEAVAKGDYAAADKEWAKANAIGVQLGGCDVADQSKIKERTSAKNAYNRKGLVASGFPSVDSAMKGGAAHGELWLIVAKPGWGKSRFLLNIAYNAYMEGKKVLYVSLEMSEDIVAGRADQLILNAPIEDCMGSVACAALAQRYADAEARGGKLWVKAYQPGSVSLKDIAGYAMHLDWAPDLIITDYLDRVAMHHYADNYWESQRMLFEEGRKISGDLNCSHWTACQPKNLKGEDVQTISGEQMAGSYGKAATLDGGFSMLASEREVEVDGIFSLFCFKNRVGPSRFYAPMKIDLSSHRVYDAPKAPDDME